MLGPSTCFFPDYLLTHPHVQMCLFSENVIQVLRWNMVQDQVLRFAHNKHVWFKDHKCFQKYGDEKFFI